MGREVDDPDRHHRQRGQIARLGGHVVGPQRAADLLLATRKTLPGG
jgi:hypothetical protein